LDRDWDKLRKWIIKRKLEGKSVTDICSEAQIDRKMFYRWWNRYQTHGWKGLEEKTKGRPTGPEPDDFVKEKVIKLRKRYEWGPKKLAGSLRLKGYDVDHNEAYRIICEAGLNHPIIVPRKTWGTRRFQREHCNSLWQADFNLCNDDYWMISYQDDRSRFITGSIKIWNPTGENAMLLLDKAVKHYGAPRQILTDQGTQFTPARGEISAFDRHCSELGIEHIVASVRRPTTCGKIEAFHKAYQTEAHLFREHWSFIRYYNYTRPHEGINYLTPAEIYLKNKV
jgi:transposase InsO family protein